MTAPQLPAAGVPMPANEVIEEIGEVHARTIAALSTEIAQHRVQARQLTDQIRYLQSRVQELEAQQQVYDAAPAAG